MAGLSISAHDYRTVVLFLQFAIVFLFAAAARFLLNLQPFLGLLVLLVVSITSVLGPKYFLDNKIAKRRDIIRKELPDVLDLLVVSVEAGLGLDSAIVRLGKKKKRLIGIAVDHPRCFHGDIPLRLLSKHFRAKRRCGT
jgi:tight adherence protein C